MANKLVKDGTQYRFQIGALCAEGTVGGTVRVYMDCRMIDGRADLDKLIDRLYELRSAIEYINGYDGKWSYVDPFDKNGGNERCLKRR